MGRNNRPEFFPSPFRLLLHHRFAPPSPALNAGTDDIDKFALIRGLLNATQSRDQYFP